MSHAHKLKQGAAPFETLSAAEIESRLDSLAEMDAAHAARDMDVELREAMLAGKDIDALEQMQLEAEKTSRRGRVERQALEAQLPHAVLREGEIQLQALKPEYAKMRNEAAALAAAAADAWDVFASALDKWAAAQGPAQRLSKQACEIAERTGAAVPAMGTFTSDRLSKIRRTWEREDHHILARLTCGERGVNGMAQQVDGEAK